MYKLLYGVLPDGREILDFCEENNADNLMEELNFHYKNDTEMKTHNLHPRGFLISECIKCSDYLSNTEIDNTSFPAFDLNKAPVLVRFLAALWKYEPYYHNNFKDFEYLFYNLKIFDARLSNISIAPSQNKILANEFSNSFNNENLLKFRIKNFSKEDNKDFLSEYGIFYYEDPNEPVSEAEYYKENQTFLHFFSDVYYSNVLESTNLKESFKENEINIVKKSFNDELKYKNNMFDRWESIHGPLLSKRKLNKTGFTFALSGIDNIDELIKVAFSWLKVNNYHIVSCLYCGNILIKKESDLFGENNKKIRNFCNKDCGDSFENDESKYTNKVNRENETNHQKAIKKYEKQIDRIIENKEIENNQDLLLEVKKQKKIGKDKLKQVHYDNRFDINCDQIVEDTEIIINKILNK